MATIVYIDGFNLYYGSVRNSPYKWLDLERMSRLLLPKDDIAQIRYFTAHIKDRSEEIGQAQRQQTYLRALKTLPLVTVHLGYFLTHPVRLPRAKPGPTESRTVEVIKTEEKGSDVNLATYLLLDSFKHRCETAVVISNDSDLKEPIRVLRRELGVAVGIVNPHPPQRRSRVLEGTFHKQLRKSVLERSQLPEVVNDELGAVHKPSAW